MGLRKPWLIAFGSWPALVLIGIELFRYFMRGYFPPEEFVEQLWLSWLGRTILATGQIPHALGAETLTSAGSPWVPQEWLFATVLATGQHLGLPALTMVLVALLGVTPLIVAFALCLRNKVDAYQALAAVFIMMSVMDLVFQVRASIAAFAVFSAVVGCVRTGGRWIYMLPLLALLAVNLHVSGLLIAVLPAILCAASFLDEHRFGEQTRRYLIATPFAFAASLCTPFGPELWSYGIGFSHGAARKYIQEWVATFDFSHHSSLIWVFRESWLFLAALYIIAVIAAKKRPPWTELAIVGITSAMFLYAIRFSAYMGIAVVLFAFSRPLPFTPEQSERLAQLRSPASALALLLAAYSAGAIWNATLPLRSGRTYDAVTQVYAPAAWTVAARLPRSTPRRVYCTNFSMCDVYLNAGDRVYTDGRFDGFPESIWSNVITINLEQDDWRSRLADLRIDTLVTTTNAPLEKTFSGRKDWTRVFHNDQQSVFVRSSADRSN